MLNISLQTDFDNIREEESYHIGKVIDNAEEYIHFLEQKQRILENAIDYLNKIDDSGKNETKEEILTGFAAVIS